LQESHVRMTPWGAICGIVLLFVLGYVVYARFASTIIGAAGHSPVTLPVLAGLAAAGGVASFFSPCSVMFAPSLLLAAGPKRPFVRVLLVGLGIVAFYLVLGAAVDALGLAVAPVLGWVIPAFGMVFLSLGGMVLTGRSEAVGRLLPWSGLAAHHPGDRPGPLVTYGILYGASAHGCSLPIFLGVVIAPLAAGEAGSAVIVTLVYGLTITACLVLAAAWGRSLVLASDGRILGYRLGELMGGLFVLMGGYFIVYFLTHMPEVLR